MDLDQCEILWSFNTIRKPLTDPQVILVLGSNDIGVAMFAAKLALDHGQAVVVCSGGVAHERDLLKTPWNIPEADAFADMMVECGVAAERILRERTAANTAQNILFSRKLLQANSIRPDKILIVQKPFMCLRALLTARHNWRGPNFGVDHEQITFAEYYRRTANEHLIDIIVGDTQRIIRYPELKYFAPVEIPPEVNLAMSHLIGRGFIGHLLS
jgi:hypothetical protein